mmetsp:Transcript_58122/g.138288  ORF Transcript_58122/g.138288 Transcript_58122/m.138288 type:complete len:234 (+) Transcript_58122:1015-1716(+)
MPLSALQLFEVDLHILFDGSFVLDAPAICCLYILVIGSNGNIVWYVVRLPMLNGHQVVPPLLRLFHRLAHLIDSLKDFDLLPSAFLLRSCIVAVQLLCFTISHMCDDGFALKDLKPPNRLGEHGQATGLEASTLEFIGFLKAQDVVLVLAPCVHQSACRQSEGRILDRCNLHDLHVLLQLHQGRSVDRGTTVVFAQAELPLLIVAPGPNLTHVGERYHMFIANLDVLHWVRNF